VEQIIVEGKGGEINWK